MLQNRLRQVAAQESRREHNNGKLKQNDVGSSTPRDSKRKTWRLLYQVRCSTMCTLRALIRQADLHGAFVNIGDFVLEFLEKKRT